MSFGSGISDIPVAFSPPGLAPDTVYYFRIVATNSAGTTRGSILSFKTLVPAPVVTTLEPAIATLDPLDGTVTVTLSGQFQSTTPATGTIELSTDPAFGSILYTAPLGAVSGVAQVTITPADFTFELGTFYYYRATATNPGGTTIGNIASFRTPGAPTPIVGSNDPVPNEPPGTAFIEFGSPAVDRGMVGGAATITRPNGASATIIFGGADGSVLASTGGAAPTGETFISFGDPVFGGDAFGFAATSFPSDTPAQPFGRGASISRVARPLPGLWSSRSSVAGLQQIAVQGGNAPGVTGGKFAKLSGFGLPRNRAGLIFLGTLGVGTVVPKESTSGIWRERPTGGVDLLLRSGSPLEITGGGIRQLRKVLFMTSVTHAPDQRRGFAPDGGLGAAVSFADGTSGIARIAADGTTDIPVETTSPVPTLDGAQFASFGTPATASARRFAFRGTLKRGLGGVTAKDDQAIFASLGGGAIQPIVRRGATLPGSGTATLDRLGEPLLGEGGVIGLVAALKGNGVSAKNRDAIVLRRGGTSTVVARLGDPAPEAGDGVIFQRFVSVVVTDTPQARLLFTATLTGTGINKRNRTGVWCVTPSGAVRLVLRLGSQTTIGSERPTVTLIDALNAKPANRGQGRSTDASGFFSARVKLSDRRSGLLRIPLP